MENKNPRIHKCRSKEKDTEKKILEILLMENKNRRIHKCISKERLYR